MDTTTAGDITRKVSEAATSRGWSLIELAERMGYDYLPPFHSAGELTVRELFDAATALDLTPSELTR